MSTVRTSRGARPRARFWAEAAAAGVCGVLALVTVFWADWIEALTGFDPDRHDGSAEWLIVAGLALVCVVASLAGRAEWRRAWIGREAERAAA
jgi:peptidoglycan/LPS O-acetylase OafA/YrhL